MKKALVVVDFQNDFIDGALGFKKAESIKKIIEEKIKKFDGELIFTLDTHDENYLNTKEGKALPIVHCQRDTKGHDLAFELSEVASKVEAIFYKPSFGSLDLANFLHAKNYDEIEFCGLVSHICVFANIILAHSASLNTKLILDTKATASFDESLEKAAFEILKVFNVELI